MERLFPVLLLFWAAGLVGCGDGANSESDAGAADAGTDGGEDEPVLAVKLAAGTNHTCVLTSTGGVKCWGGSCCGEIGSDDYPQTTAIPVDVVGFESGAGALDVSAGCDHTCAVDAAGGVFCWGDNFDGQLGAPVGASSDTPVQVTGLDSGYVAVAAGCSHTCALSAAGAVRCWGDNDSGELGDGTTQGSVEPVEVSALSATVTSFTAGGEVTCAITEETGAVCWGAGDLCGVNVSENQPEPVEVIGMAEGVLSISAAGAHVCGALVNGGMKCWGSDGRGQLGDGGEEFAYAPVDVVSIDSVVRAIATGDDNSCAALPSGELQCWGSNEYGQLGQGTAGGESNVPVEVPGLGGLEITGMAVGWHHVCAVTAVGGLKCWGDYSDGQLGNGMGLDENECVEWDDCIQPTPVDVIGFGPEE